MTENSLLPTSGAERLSPAVVTRMFADFWAHYPRKVGKGAAAKAFAKAVKANGPEPIRAGYKRALAAWATWPPDDRQFIPHPATWLNQERWCDEPEPHVTKLSPTQAKEARSMAANERAAARRRVGTFADEPNTLEIESHAG